MPAIPPHDTAVVDEQWDANAQVGKIKTPIGKSVGADEWAWYDASGPDPDKDGYPDEKGDYKFPHHQVSSDGKPGAAVASALRDGLARLSQADIPEGDRAGVKRHLQHHLDAFDRNKSAARTEAYLAELEQARIDAIDDAREEHAYAHLADSSGYTTVNTNTTTSQVVLNMDATNATVISEPEPEPQTGIISAGYSDMDLLRAEHASLEMILGKPWAITREAAIEAATRIAMLTKAGLSHDVLAQVEAALQRPSATAVAKSSGNVAVIPLRGTITPRGSLFSLMFGGGGGLQAFRAQFKEAVADNSISAIVLDIDSPGGLIDLVTETASDVYKARGSKPIVAVANTCTASAAYWIASQADSIVATPSGMVGSVGVFTVHEDYSKMEQMMGIKTTLISAGDHKTDGNPYEPLSKSALQAIQNEVDQIYSMFTAQVAEGRGISQKAVQAGYGNGRCLLASEAYQRGMVDRVDTLEATVARLGGVTADPAPDADDVIGVGDGDEDDGITALAGADEGFAEALTVLQQASANELVSLADAQVSTKDYLNSEALREQPAWHI